MGGQLSRAEVEEVKQRNPIAAVVESYGIELKPQGRALVGRCPFHDDQGRPNLSVYPETGSWYCYRCSAGGDVLAFVMRREGISFPAAFRLLKEREPAARVVSIGAARKAERRWDRLTLEEQQVMNTVGAVYREVLLRTPPALDYLRARGISDPVIQECRLGYADGHSLAAALHGRPALHVAEQLGLLRRRKDQDDPRLLQEVLAGRIVVPELRADNCIWFIGRCLNERSSPKYLALEGERPILGYERAAGRKEVFLVEGVFDWLTAVSWRLPACSPCGTSLPAERLGFLAQAEVIYGVMDGDEAGRAAAQRFREQLGERFVPIPLPEGCDLNDLGGQPDGKDGFLRSLTKTRQAMRQSQSHRSA